MNHHEFARNVRHQMAGLICCFISANAFAQGSDSINWSITPYLWASDTKADLLVRGVAIGGEKIAFDDLMDVIDTAGMVHVEGGKGNWSLFADVTYLSMSDSDERRILTVDSRSKQTFIDLAASWWPVGFGDNLSFYGGLRYSDFSDRYRFYLGDNQVGDTKSAASYYDLLVGLRYRFDLSDRWALLTRGDVSFGDSKGTWLVQANFSYALGESRRHRIMFGYQFKEAEFENGDVVTRFSYHGPTAGFNFRF